MTSRDFRPLAPANFIGIQDCFGDPPIELFILTKPVGDHPVNSTVSRQTLEKHGYEVPVRDELVRQLALRPKPLRMLTTATAAAF